MKRLFAALLAVMAAPALAELPVNGCYAVDYDAEHLAAHPEQGVASLRLWFHDEVPGQTAHRAVAVEAVMANQGQALRDLVAGLTLTQYAYCEASNGRCGVECDGGAFEVSTEDTSIIITTSNFVIGDPDLCGGVSDLSENDPTRGGETRYVLAAASVDACQALWSQHPLPAPGCYGADYADGEAGQGVLALRLWVDTPDPDLGAPAYALLSARLGVILPDTGRAAAAQMGGAQVSRDLWCSTFDGACRGQVAGGWFLIAPDEAGVQITVPTLVFAGRGVRQFDLAVPGEAPVVHRLQPMRDAQCRGVSAGR